MKLFFIVGLASAASAGIEDDATAQLIDYDIDDNVNGERELEGIGLLSDLSGMDLVLSTAVNQAVSSTIVPVVGLAGGFARSAFALIASLSSLRPSSMMPTSFYSIVSNVIQSFADPTSNQIQAPVPMDEFLDRLKTTLARYSVVDFDSFRRVVTNLQRIVLLYPFVTTGSYLTYLTSVLGTLEAVLTNSQWNPTQRPLGATIPLAPRTNPIPTVPGKNILGVPARPLDPNIPNFGWTGALDSGVLGALLGFGDTWRGADLLNHFRRQFPALNPNSFISLDGLLTSPVWTGFNALGAINQLGASLKADLLEPVGVNPTNAPPTQPAPVLNPQLGPFSLLPALAPNQFLPNPFQIQPFVHPQHPHPAEVVIAQPIPPVNDPRPSGIIATPIVSAFADQNIIQPVPVEPVVLRAPAPPQAILPNATIPMLPPWHPKNVMPAVFNSPLANITRFAPLRFDPLQANLRANLAAFDDLWTRKRFGVVDEAALEEQAPPVSNEFVWSLPDASVYFLQRLDQIRPHRMSPASFLQIVNRVIREAESINALDLFTPGKFARTVASSLEARDVDDEELNSITTKVESALNGPFPEFVEILNHISNVITEKLGN